MIMDAKGSKVLRPRNGRGYPAHVIGNAVMSSTVVKVKKLNNQGRVRARVSPDVKTKRSQAKERQSCKLAENSSVRNADDLYRFDAEISNSVPYLSRLRSGAVHVITSNSNETHHQNVIQLEDYPKKIARNSSTTFDNNGCQVQVLSSFCLKDELDSELNSVSGHVYNKTSTPLNLAVMCSSLHQKQSVENTHGFQQWTGCIKHLTRPLTMSPVISLHGSVPSTAANADSSFSNVSKSVKVSPEKYTQRRRSFLSLKDQSHACHQEAMGDKSDCITDAKCQTRITRSSLSQNIKSVASNNIHDDDERVHTVKEDEYDSGIIIKRSFNGVLDCSSCHSYTGSDGSYRNVNEVQKAKAVSDKLNVNVQVKQAKHKHDNRKSKRKATNLVSCSEMKLSIDSSLLVCTSNRKVAESDSGVMTDLSSIDYLYTDVDESKPSCKEIIKDGTKRLVIKKDSHRKTSKSKTQHEKPISKNSNENAVSDRLSQRSKQFAAPVKKTKNCQDVLPAWNELFSDLDDIATNYELIIE